MKTDTLLRSAVAGKRLNCEEGLLLLTHAPLLELGWAASQVCKRFHPDSEPVTFVIDRNVNYTNICNTYCSFCAFYAPPGSSNGYVLPYETIKTKIEELVSLNGTQLLLQGGHNPQLGIKYYEELFSQIRADFPTLTLHALSPSEIDHIACVSNLSLEDTIGRLIVAGLSSVPGGGAEILTEAVKAKISPLKMSASRWLAVMECAHTLGLKTSATMMFGSLESAQDRIEHLIKLRDLQEKTGGFTAFIAWSFQSGNTALGKKVKQQAPGAEYLRMVAISRLMLDNIKNVQTSWVTQGLELGQTALSFGANDFGGTMLEENVVSAAGTYYQVTLKQIIEAVHKAGYDAAQRDTQYNILKVLPRKQVALAV